jgi:hypothetical protein
MPERAAPAAGGTRESAQDVTPHLRAIVPILQSCLGDAFVQHCDKGTPTHRKCYMRISDDRYARERLSLDLALRFLRHEARTQTIRTWTGLTDDRKRNLYRSYMSRGAQFVPRPLRQVPSWLHPSCTDWKGTKALSGPVTRIGAAAAQPGTEGPGR